MHLPKVTVVRQRASVLPAIAGERAIAGGSGVYEIRLRGDEWTRDRVRETDNRDEFAGLDRLDREELDDDETPGTTPVGIVHDIGVTRRYRRSA
jgi:hypothetical protein